ncbi:P-loop NTPase [Actinoplanes sp. N902-109]|uniref:AAA family ATPase n=1 Tax=Actinoplanes sp. (strain N902-109) TaxID=649831 RepID=UPI0003296858|nr:P-loop NTPase [Actinoplanes sp. N902-109]AGL14851.1 response regulator [Actinoplanes sp. N902-109]
MTFYVYVEPDAERRSTAGAVYSEYGFAIVDSLADLEYHLPRNPETLLVMIGATVDLEEALTFAAYQRVQRPLLGVIVLRRTLEPDVLARAMRSGVREVVDELDAEGIRVASARSIDLSKALSTTLRSSPDVQRAKVVTVFAGKGGCGKSVVATNLAAALCADGSRRVLLVDLALQFGDVAIMLQLPPNRSISDAISMAGKMDEAGLRSVITPCRPGLDALLAPSSPAEGEHVSRELVTEILEVARDMYDYIVLDTPPAVTDQVLSALDLTDWFVPIVTPDLPTLKSVRLTIEMFDLLEYPRDRRLVVFNRANTEVGLSLEDVEEAVGAHLSVHVPSSRDVTVSVNRGVPLVLSDPTHPVSLAIRKLADRCAGVSSNVESRRRLFALGRKR